MAAVSTVLSGPSEPDNGNQTGTNGERNGIRWNMVANNINSLHPNHCLHTAGVDGSIPSAPTKLSADSRSEKTVLSGSNEPQARSPLRRFLENYRLWLEISDRFWEKVDAQGPTDCWPWTAATKNGYGWFKFHSGITIYASRAAYALHWRQDPEQFVVMHTCDNRVCCNPGHLVLGSVKDNNQDKAIKGRNRTGDRRGTKNGNNKLTEDQAREIHRRIAAGENNTSIARDFPISHHTVSLIRLGRIWRHVA